MSATAISPVQFNLFAEQNSVYVRFTKFHTQYPKVYELFKAFALDLIRKGHTRIGARMIIERIRWEFATGSKDDMGFKINNDFICHYARLFINEHKEYAEYFDTRQIKRL